MFLLPPPHRLRPVDVEPPLATAVHPVGSGRVIEVAEFGAPDGEPVLWLHGTPGSCRQVAPAAKLAAQRRGLRVIGVARPGAGRSTVHAHTSVADVARDLARVAASLGLDRYAVVGLSGGGPYALGLAAIDRPRVAGVAVLGGVAPTVGPDAATGGIQALAHRAEPLLRRVRRPVGWAATMALRPLTYVPDPLFDAFTSIMPEGDKAVFATPGVREMFIDDLSRSIHANGLHAAVQDAVLFGRDWGFRLADVTRPVHWWHGDADTIVGLDHGMHVWRRLPDAVLEIRSGDSHLSGYAAAEHVIDVVGGFFDR